MTLLECMVDFLFHCSESYFDSDGEASRYLILMYDCTPQEAREAVRMAARQWKPKDTEN